MECVVCLGSYPEEHHIRWQKLSCDHLLCRPCSAKASEAIKESNWSIVKCPLCCCETFSQFHLHWKEKECTYILPGVAKLKDLQALLNHPGETVHDKRLFPEVALHTSKRILLPSDFDSKQDDNDFLISYLPWSVVTRALKETKTALLHEIDVTLPTTGEFVKKRYYEVQCMLAKGGLLGRHRPLSYLHDTIAFKTFGHDEEKKKAYKISVVALGEAIDLESKVLLSNFFPKDFNIKVWLVLLRTDLEKKVRSKVFKHNCFGVLVTILQLQDKGLLNLLSIKQKSITCCICKEAKAPTDDSDCMF